MRIVSTGIVIFLAALAVIGFLFKGYFDRNTAADNISAQLADKNTMVSNLSAQNAALESQINDNVITQANFQKAISAAADNIPNRKSSKTMVHDILDLCAEHNVTAIPLSTNNWAPTQIEKRTLYVYKINLKLSGGQADLIGCVQDLQSQLYPTLVMEYLALLQTPATATTNFINPPLLTTVDLSMAIYAK
jgi:hypothetical protein